MFPLPAMQELQPAVYAQDPAFHDHIHEPGFVAQQVQDQPGLDPNSPELFKQSLHIVHEHVVRAQNLARNVIAMIQSSYHPGCNPDQIEADIAALKRALKFLSDLMHHTGVGALPLLSSEATTANDVPTEEQIIADTTQAVQAQYELLNRLQDGASAVANLLSVSDTAARPVR